MSNGIGSYEYENGSWRVILENGRIFDCDTQYEAETISRLVKLDFAFKERIRKIIDELAEDDGYINAKDLLKRL